MISHSVYNSLMADFYVCYYSFTFLLFLSSLTCSFTLLNLLHTVLFEYVKQHFFVLLVHLQVCISLTHCSLQSWGFCVQQICFSKSLVLCLQFSRILLLYQTCISPHDIIVSVIKYPTVHRIAACYCCFFKTIIITYKDNKIKETLTGQLRKVLSQQNQGNQSYVQLKRSADSAALPGLSSEALQTLCKTYGLLAMAMP